VPSGPWITPAAGETPSQYEKLFKEVNGSLTKISVRSRGAVDAAALCASFGGGGHIRAAGAEIERPMDEAVKMVLAASKEAILAASSES